MVWGIDPRRELSSQISKMFEIGSKIDKKYVVQSKLHEDEFKEVYLLTNGCELVVDRHVNGKYDLELKDGNRLLKRMLQKKVGDELNGTVIGERVPTKQYMGCDGERYQFGDDVLVLREIHHQPVVSDGLINQCNRTLMSHAIRKPISVESSFVIFIPQSNRH